MADITIKDQVLKAIEEMPSEVTFSDVMDRLYFLYKVDQGLKQVEAGDTISHEEAKKRSEIWRK
jgi:predicted CopG family antitoxin